MVFLLHLTTHPHCIGIGGDPIIGSDFIDILTLFEEDPLTEQVVLIGAANLPGVAELSAKTTSDLIPCSIVGVHKLPVTGKGVADAGTAIAFGQVVFYDTVTEVINIDTGETRYGIALGAVASGAGSGVIAAG